MIVGALLVAVLIVLVVMMLRRRTPDPKLKLLLTLMQDFPKDDEGGGSEGSDDGSDPRADHGPLGPDGFSHIAHYYASKVLFGNPPQRGRHLERPADKFPVWGAANPSGTAGQKEMNPGGRI